MRRQTKHKMMALGFSMRDAHSMLPKTRYYCRRRCESHQEKRIRSGVDTRQLHQVTRIGFGRPRSALRVV